MLGGEEGEAGSGRFNRRSGERKGKPAVLGEEARGRGRKKRRNGGGEADLAGSDGGGIRGRVAKEEEDARAGCIWRERRARCRCSRLAAALRVPMRRGCREAHNLEEGAPLRVKRKARNRRYLGGPEEKGGGWRRERRMEVACARQRKKKRGGNMLICFARIVCCCLMGLFAAVKFLAGLAKEEKRCATCA